MGKLIKSTISNNPDIILGLGLKPGDSHYRAYVGPPVDYDLVAAMSFNLLTTVGLRQHHRVLDIGCGSLRIGRLIVPYLNPGNYVGIEPNKWLIQEGIDFELGRDMVRIKTPRILVGDSASCLEEDERFDFALAQSIFSHCGKDLINGWLKGTAAHIFPTGILFATFIKGDEDFSGEGWIYPDCVRYTEQSVSEMAARAGLRVAVLDWRHPRQTWAAFIPDHLPKQWFELRSLNWNNKPDFNPSGKI